MLKDNAKLNRCKKLPAGLPVPEMPVRNLPLWQGPQYSLQE